MQTPIITLTTDMGLKDHYVAAVKGALLSACPKVQIIDISHQISPFDIAQAAFAIKNCYEDFPKGSIHILGVDPDLKYDHQNPVNNINHVVCFHKGHYFIGADNGIFSLIFDSSPEQIFEITITPENADFVFPVKNRFVKIATHLANGNSMAQIGLPKEELRIATLYQPVHEENVIRGTVIYIDYYGNIFTNISKTLFEKIKQGRDFALYFRNESYVIRKISNFFHDVSQGEKLALFSSNNLLMISINKGVQGSGGSASSLLGLNLRDIVRIEFSEPAAPTGSELFQH